MPEELHTFYCWLCPISRCYTIKFKSSPHSENRRNIGTYELVKIESASSEELAEYNARPIMVRLKEHPNNPKHHQKFVKGHQPKEVDGVLRMPEGTQLKLKSMILDC